tara:strand:+ start:2585 stop:2818 length:234 start_codon:yes stop_codon:yes gene_type:complete
MEYNEALIEKTVKCVHQTDKYRVDKLLYMDAVQYQNLGKDSTKTEKQEVKKKSRVIYRAISKINPTLGKSLLLHQDK